MTIILDVSDLETFHDTEPRRRLQHILDIHSVTEAHTIAIATGCTIGEAQRILNHLFAAGYERIEWLKCPNCNGFLEQTGYGDDPYYCGDCDSYPLAPSRLESARKPKGETVIVRPALKPQAEEKTEPETISITAPKPQELPPAPTFADLEPHHSMLLKGGFGFSALAINIEFATHDPFPTSVFNVHATGVVTGLTFGQKQYTIQMQIHPRILSNTKTNWSSEQNNPFTFDPTDSLVFNETNNCKVTDHLGLTFLQRVFDAVSDFLINDPLGQRYARASEIAALYANAAALRSTLPTKRALERTIEQWARNHQNYEAALEAYKKAAGN